MRGRAVASALCLVALLYCTYRPRSQERGDSILLERGPCFGTCPVYSVLLRADGTARFVGHENAQLRGEWVGTFEPGLFLELLKMMRDAGFWSLQDRYERPVTDNATAIVAVLHGSAALKRVSNYASAGPLALAGVESAIDLVAARCDWKPVSSTEH